MVIELARRSFFVNCLTDGGDKRRKVEKREIGDLRSIDVIAGNGLRDARCGLRVARCEMRVGGYELRGACWGLRDGCCGLQVAVRKGHRTRVIARRAR